MLVPFLKYLMDFGVGEAIGDESMADRCAEKEGKELQIAKETQKLNW